MTDLRQLDRLVAEHVMGWEVPANAAPSIFVEGEWSIHADADEGSVGSGSGWMCYSGMEPVYVESCAGHDGPAVNTYEAVASYMKTSWSPQKIAAYVKRQNAEHAKAYAKDMDRWGHERHCLNVIPRFSSSIADAWLVVEKMRTDWDLTLESSTADDTVPPRWYAAFGSDMGWWEDTVTEAICYAALAALRVEVPT